MMLRLEGTDHQDDEVVNDSGCHGESLQKVINGEVDATIEKAAAAF